MPSKSDEPLINPRGRAPEVNQPRADISPWVLRAPEAFAPSGRRRRPEAPGPDLAAD